MKRVLVTIPQNAVLETFFPPRVVRTVSVGTRTFEMQDFRIALFLHAASNVSFTFISFPEMARSTYHFLFPSAIDSKH